VNLLNAVISGILGTLAISMVMAVAPKMGMPKMDIVDMLSTMFGKPNRVLGWMMHLMMGVVFALAYAFLDDGVNPDHACRDQKRRRGSPWSVDD